MKQLLLFFVFFVAARSMLAASSGDTSSAKRVTSVRPARQTHAALGRYQTLKKECNEWRECCGCMCAECVVPCAKYMCKECFLPCATETGRFCWKHKKPIVLSVASYFAFVQAAEWARVIPDPLGPMA